MAQATDPVTGRPTALGTDLTQDSDNPEAIAGDIRETRAEMSDTISAIADKLDPSRLIDDAKDALFSSGRDAGMSMLDQVKDSSVLDTIKANPVPAMAVGLSLAWFLSKMGESEGDSYRRDQYERTGDPLYAPYRGQQDRGYSGAGRYASGQAGASGDSLLDTAKDKASDLVESAKDAASDLGDKASSLTDRASSAVSDATETVQSRAHDTGRTAQRYGRQTGSWLDHQLQQNPLSVGAVALAAGALVGLSVPESDLEHQAFGDRADAAKSQLAGAAQDAADTVTSKAQTVVDEAARKAKSVGQEAQDKAATVAHEAKDRAGAVAEQAKDDVDKATPDANAS